MESALKKSLIGCGWWACLPFAAIAQTQATDPASPVPPVTYRSVFADTSRGVETDTLEWKTANDEVGRLTRGHIDILKWEAAQRKSEARKPAMAMPHSPATETTKP